MVVLLGQLAVPVATERLDWPQSGKGLFLEPVPMAVEATLPPLDLTMEPFRLKSDGGQSFAVCPVPARPKVATVPFVQSKTNQELCYSSERDGIWILAAFMLLVLWMTYKVKRYRRDR